MSAALKVASARQQSRPPTKGRARVLERRLLANPRLAYQYSVLPLAVRPVLMAAIELVVLHGDGEAHYAPDLAAGDERTLAEVLAWRMNAPLAAAEIGRSLEALAQAGLLALSGGGLRLGAIYAKGRANTSPSLGGTSELKRLTAIENGKRGGRPPEAVKAARQVTMLLPIGGGLDGALAAAIASGSVPRSAPGAAEASPGAPDGTHAEPTVGYSGTQTGTQTEPTVGFPETQTGTQTGGVGFSVGFPSPAQREYPVAAAALEETNNFNSLAAAAAAIPGAGANARGETQETQTETQTEPTAGLSGPRGDPPKPGPSPDAVGLGEAMARQFHFTAEHRDEAPGCMQGYLDAGYDAGQIRAVLEAKRGRKASSARMLQKALAAQFPEVSYRGRGEPAPPAGGPSQAAQPASAEPPPQHPDLATVPGAAGFGTELRHWVNGLLRDLDQADADLRARKAKFVYDLKREAFEAVARLRPELWPLVGRDPPGSG